MRLWSCCRDQTERCATCRPDRRGDGAVDGGGYVYYDKNNDGLFAGADTPIEGATVALSAAKRALNEASLHTIEEQAELQEKIEAQLAALKKAPRLVRSFFKAPTVAYITDW